MDAEEIFGVLLFRFELEGELGVLVEDEWFVTAFDEVNGFKGGVDVAFAITAAIIFLGSTSSKPESLSSNSTRSSSGALSMMAFQRPLLTPSWV